MKKTDTPIYGFSGLSTALMQTKYEASLHDSSQRCHIIYPGGNPTLLIENMDGLIPAHLYANIAALGMQLRPNIEQVGYIVPGEHCRYKLDMMGGDVCYNGLRSLAFWCYAQEGITQCSLECSGTSEIFTLHTYTSHQEIITTLECDNVFTMQHDSFGTFVDMGGIIHYVQRVDVWDKNKAQDTLYRLIDFYTQRTKIPEALGLITLCNDSLHPLVYVSATKTTVYESECGSGTVAAHVVFGGTQFIPPSGEIFYVKPGQGTLLLRAPIRWYSDTAVGYQLPESNTKYYEHSVSAFL